MWPQKRWSYGVREACEGLESYAVRGNYGGRWNYAVREACAKESPCARSEVWFLFGAR